MNTIVVGFDGTAASLVALDWVAERAARGPTRVEIVMIAGTILMTTSASTRPSSRGTPIA